MAENFLVADWIKTLDMPAVLVTGSYLGCLSDTLSTLAALAAKNTAIAGVVISESENPAMSLSETRDALAEQISDIKIAGLKRIHKMPLWQHADDLTSLVEGL